MNDDRKGPHRSSTSMGTRIGDDLAWLEALIARARNNAEHITDSMLRFVDDMAVNAKRWGAEMYFSKNQRAFARGIEAALDHAGVPNEGEQE